MVTREELVLFRGCTWVYGCVELRISLLAYILTWPAKGSGPKAEAKTSVRWPSVVGESSRGTTRRWSTKNMNTPSTTSQKPKGLHDGRSFRHPDHVRTRFLRTISLNVSVSSFFGAGRQPQRSRTEITHHFNSCCPSHHTQQHLGKRKQWPVTQRPPPTNNSTHTPLTLQLYITPGATTEAPRNCPHQPKPSKTLPTSKPHIISTIYAISSQLRATSKLFLEDQDTIYHACQRGGLQVLSVCVLPLPVTSASTAAHLLGKRPPSRSTATGSLY